jgi:hypothetical protein
MKRIRRSFKKCFIPHPENDHKPKILRFWNIAFVCALMIAAEIIFFAGPSYLISRSKLFGVIMVNALVDETNENRLTDHLSVLHINPLLQAAAQEKANDMASKGYFAHTSPSGLSPWYWFGKVGYDFTAAGENLAVNFSDSQDVTNAWMNSPEHRANIMNGNFTDIGIATAKGTFEGRPAVYVVQLFGLPALAPVMAIAPAKTSAASSTAVAKSKTVSVPVSVSAVSANNASGSATATQAFAAVKGAETQNATQTLMPSLPVKPQNNPIQDAVAAPHSLANDFYLFIIGLFAAALALDIFIKIRIQYPNLIFGGVLVIALAVVFIVLNQHGVSLSLRIG